MHVDVQMHHPVMDNRFMFPSDPGRAFEEGPEPSPGGHIIFGIFPFLTQAAPVVYHDQPIHALGHNSAF